MTSKFGGRPVSKFGAQPVIESAVEQPAPVEQVQPVVEQSETIDTVLPAPVAEFASAANRSILDFADFMGPNAINSILTLAGSDKRVPTLREVAGGVGIGEEGFMEPGLARDVVQAAGETAPVALGTGQVARTAAERGSQIAQRLAGTATQDVTAGVLAGAGAEVGEKIGEAVGGETGAAVGRNLGALTAPLAASLGGAAVNRQIQQAAPTADALRSRASAIYNQIDDLGVTIKSEPIQQLARSIEQDLKRNGLDDILTPQASRALARMADDAQNNLTVSEIDTLRKIANIARTSQVPAEANLGRIMVNKIDDFLDDLTIDKFRGPDVNAGARLKEARGLVQRVKKDQRIQQAIELAETRSSSIDVALRNEFKNIEREIVRGKLKGFTKDEIKAIRRVSNGDLGERAVRGLAKLGMTDGQAWQVFGPAVGAFVGGALGGGPGAFAAVAVGQAAKSAASRMTANNAQLASALVRSGSNGRNIVGAYLKNVPKSQQNVDDLAALLVNEGADGLLALKASTRPIVANAAYWASVINQQINEIDEDAEE